MGTKPQLSISLSARWVKELSLELAALLREQIEALEDSGYILMDEKKAEAYEKRSERIAELKAMLGHPVAFSLQ